MQAALRIGRLGGLTIYINYTWIFASVLLLWWVALLWLPDNFPTWSTGQYWLFAVAVLLLYFCSVIAHELVHSLVSRRTERSVNLFPFGAAVPFRLRDVGPMRAIAAALAGPLFNLVLGGVLLLASGLFSAPDNAVVWLRALLVPLGWLNVWLGLVNLIPGAPFDGGLALAAGLYSFTSDREGALGLAQSLGSVAALVLVLIGAWRGLTSNLWLEALVFVVVGWSAREAAAMGQQRRLLRDVLSQMKAADFMEPSRPGDVAQETDSIADLVRAALPTSLPTRPLL